MTIASHKDLLLTTCQEWADSRQTEAEAHTKLMYSLIAALPDGEKTGEVNTLPPPHKSRPVVIHPHQNGGYTGIHTPHTPPASIVDCRQNRPVVIKASYLDDVDSEPKPPLDPKPKRAKRASEADIRKAVKLFVDSMNTDTPLTQKQAEKAAGIPQGALSKGKGREILDNCMQEISRISPRIAVPTGVRRKEVENATVYDDMR